MKIFLQIDPPATFNPATDSTVALALEAKARGHVLFYYTPQQLSADRGRIVAQASPIEFFDRAEDFFTEGAPERVALEDAADVILVRQDPPFDMAYLTTTWLLGMLRKPRVVNSPHALRERPEKLFPLLFPAFCPPTMVSTDRKELLQFHREAGAVVLKPLYGHGGRGVFLIDKEGGNLNALIEMLLDHSPEPLVMQQYLPEVAREEKRILLINGEISGAFGRLPVKGEIRSNMRVGGEVVKTELSPRQREISAVIGPICRKEGILLAGLDVIGDWLTEVNITSPTGIRTMQKLTGENPAAVFWDAVEKES